MRPVLGQICILALAAGMLADPAYAQRERTRPGPRRSTSVSESQASELTLTLTDVAIRPIQVWVRTAGAIDAARHTITAAVPAADAARVKAGQRVRAFSPQSRSRMHQGTVSAVIRQDSRTLVKVALQGQPTDAGRHYVLEIVTEDGEFLSVPNEAILESAGRQLAYVQQAGGSYEPREIAVGVRGELFTQVLGGLKAGEQVVTIGSFFIDAEHRLKGF